MFSVESVVVVLVIPLILLLVEIEDGLDTVATPKSKGSSKSGFVDGEVGDVDCVAFVDVEELDRVLTT